MQGSPGFGVDVEDTELVELVEFEIVSEVSAVISEVIEDGTSVLGVDVCMGRPVLELDDDSLLEVESDVVELDGGTAVVLSEVKLLVVEEKALPAGIDVPEVELDSTLEEEIEGVCREGLLKLGDVVLLLDPVDDGRLVAMLVDVSSLELEIEVVDDIVEKVLNTVLIDCEDMLVDSGDVGTVGVDVMVWEVAVSDVTDVSLVDVETLDAFVWELVDAELEELIRADVKLDGRGTGDELLETKVRDVTLDEGRVVAVIDVEVRVEDRMTLVVEDTGELARDELVVLGVLDELDISVLDEVLPELDTVLTVIGKAMLLLAEELKLVLDCFDELEVILEVVPVPTSPLGLFPVL